MEQAAETRGSASPEYPSFNDLPETVRKAIVLRTRYLSSCTFSEKDLFVDPQIPDSLEEKRIYLAHVSYKISSLKGIYPAPSYKFLGKVFKAVSGTV